MKLTDQQIRAIASRLMKDEIHKRNILLNKIKESRSTKVAANKIWKELNSLSKEAKVFIGSHVNETYVFNNVLNKLQSKITFATNLQDTIDKITILTIETTDLKDLLNKLGLSKDFKL